jgi:hypothetical protein
MLFDLRGPGRRRMVKIVYVTLALLLGGGLVLFGIGGEVSGGLVDAIRENPSGSDDVSERAQDAEAAALRKTQADADDPAGWAELARARVQLANTGDNVNTETGEYTESGQAILRRADEAWQKYIELDPKQVDDSLARRMVVVYAGPLSDPEQAVQAQEIVTEARPDSANQFATLAQLAWSAGQIRKGDLARDKAIELTEPDLRESLRGQLETAKQEAVGGAAAGGTGEAESGG